MPARHRGARRQRRRHPCHCHTGHVVRPGLRALSSQRFVSPRGGILLPQKVLGRRRHRETVPVRGHSVFLLGIEEIPKLVEDAAEKGVDCCFGGGVTSAHAQRVGLRTVKITPNEDSIFRSVHEALHAIKVRRRERSQAARLEMVFDSISEGSSSPTPRRTSSSTTARPPRSARLGTRTSSAGMSATSSAIPASP